MSAPTPEIIEAEHRELDSYDDIQSLPVIPDPASHAIVAAVVAVQTAQHNLQSTVGLVLATLGLSIETHDIGIEAGRAVVKLR
jgi:hypothetical protein